MDTTPTGGPQHSTSDARHRRCLPVGAEVLRQGGVHFRVWASKRHRDLLRLRREDAVFRAQRRGGLDGAVLGPEAFVLRFFGEQADDRLLVVNLGRDLALQPAPEPLLAPPEGMVWKILWSSEDPRYGGSGTAPLEAEEGWHVPGHAAVVLRPVARAEH
jgi:maltooligosyltrehalose trehalohydrolase